MIIQNPNGSFIDEVEQLEYDVNQQVYYVGIPRDLLDEQTSLLDRLISFAFDTLGVFRLVLRVRDNE